MSATNKEIAKEIVRTSDDWNWEGEQFEKYVNAITAALDLKDAKISKLEDALRQYQLFHIHIDSQIEIYKTQHSMSDAMALVPIKRMFKMVDERARLALGGE